MGVWAPGQSGIFSGSCQQWLWGLSLIPSYVWHRHSHAARQCAFVKKQCLIFNYFFLHLGFSFYQNHHYFPYFFQRQQTNKPSKWNKPEFSFPSGDLFSLFSETSSHKSLLMGLPVPCKGSIKGDRAWWELFATWECSVLQSPYFAKCHFLGKIAWIWLGS